jgi:hypothetical protein
MSDDDIIDELLAPLIAIDITELLAPLIDDEGVARGLDAIAAGHRPGDFSSTETNATAAGPHRGL